MSKLPRNYLWKPSRGLEHPLQLNHVTPAICLHSKFQEDEVTK